MRSRLGIILSALLAAFVVALSGAAPASAHTYPRVALTGATTAACAVDFCSQPGYGNRIPARYTGPYKPRMQEVCLTFFFRGNQLDTGEQLEVRVSPDLPMFGFVQMEGSTSSRTVCLDAAYTPALVRAFKDGSQALTVFAARGSFTLGAVTAAVF